MQPCMTCISRLPKKTKAKCMQYTYPNKYNQKKTCRKNEKYVISLRLFVIHICIDIVHIC